MPLSFNETTTSVKEKVCVPAFLDGHCEPEVSYVDFECLPGYFPDPNYGKKTMSHINKSYILK
jgi:hypothetical protein